jgi:adenylylsulfate reductase subunit B
MTDSDDGCARNSGNSIKKPEPEREEEMPSFVNPEKCDGCKALDKTACQYICPNDLMVLDKDKMKAFNREPEMCWECYSCVKICPQQAIDVRGYADFVPLGGSVVPLRSTDSIMWTVKFRNGMVKRFKFPIRTTPEGKAEPTGGFPPGEDLESTALFTEPQSLGLPNVWTK